MTPRRQTEPLCHMTSEGLDRTHALIMEHVATATAEKILEVGGDPDAAVYESADAALARRLSAAGVTPEATLLESIIVETELSLVAPQEADTGFDATATGSAFTDPLRRRRAAVIRQLAAMCVGSQFEFAQICTGFRRLLHPTWIGSNDAKLVRAGIAQQASAAVASNPDYRTAGADSRASRALRDVADAINRLERVEPRYGQGLRKLLMPDVERGNMTRELALGAILTGLLEGGPVAAPQRRGRPASQPSCQQTTWVWTVEALRSVCGFTQVEARRVWSNWFPETCLDDTSGALYAHSYRLVCRYFRDLERRETARVDLAKCVTERTQ